MSGIRLITSMIMACLFCFRAIVAGMLLQLNRVVFDLRNFIKKVLWSLIFQMSLEKWAFPKWRQRTTSKFLFDGSALCKKHGKEVCSFGFTIWSSNWPHQTLLCRMRGIRRLLIFWTRSKCTILIFRPNSLLETHHRTALRLRKGSMQQNRMVARSLQNSRKRLRGWKLLLVPVGKESRNGLYLCVIVILLFFCVSFPWAHARCFQLKMAEKILL